MTQKIAETMAAVGRRSQLAMTTTPRPDPEKYPPDPEEAPEPDEEPAEEPTHLPEPEPV